MARDVKPIKVTPKSELRPLLDAADSNSPVLLERRGVIYQLSTVHDSEAIDYEPDAEAVRRMLDEVAGSWADANIDQVIEGLYRARQEGSRLPARP